MIRRYVINLEREDRFQYLIAILCVIIYAGCLFFPLADKDAAHHVNIALHMLQFNDYYSLVDRYTPYLDKPHFLFWISAASFKLFGVTTFAHRLPAVLFGLISIYSTYQLTRHLFNKTTAKIAALTLATAQGFIISIIVESFPKDQPIIFAPDKNLGAYINKVTGRNMVLWNGACMVHEIFSLEKIVKLKTKHPNAKFIAHPECEEPILRMADYIGSTTGLLKYTQKDDAKEYIVATETGILHQMMKSSPHKTFIPAPPTNNCACNDCPHMKRNTLEKLYLCMKYEMPEILMDEELRIAAKKPIDRMLEISAQAGL